MAFILLACGLLLLSLGYMFKRNGTKRRLPPGPKGIPILGNLLQMDMKNFSAEMSSIGIKYGQACSFKLMNQNIVLVSSYKLMKESLASPKYAQVFSGRPSLFFEKYLAKGTVGMSTYSSEWLAHKKLLLRGIGAYGSHSAEVEELVQDQLKTLIGSILRDANTPVDPHDYVQGYVSGVLVMLLTGKNHKHDDPILRLCTEIAIRVDRLLRPDTSALMTNMPWLRFLPAVDCGRLYKKLHQDLELLRKKVYDELKTKGEKKCFLEFIVEEKEKGNLKEENVSGVMVDMVVGGTGTSHTSLYSMFLVLAANPEIQARAQAEIDRVIGPSRLPCIRDKERMPYTHAILWELLRYYPALPLGLPHCTMDNVEFMEYILPKDTVVLYSMWNVHHDETFWENGWEFNPSRFLDNNGNIVPPENEKRQRVVIFGFGKRQCPGEVFAKIRLFLALAATLQKFTILPDPASPLPDADPRTFQAHLMLRAPRYKVIFHPRV